MSWLRIDDGFMQHPKFAGWKPGQKWAFLELMGYCAKYRTDGYIPPDLALLPRSITHGLLALAEASKWLEKDEESGLLCIHDWTLYNPKDATASERMRRFRAKDNRNDAVTPTDDNRNADRNETVTRAQARAVPVPSRPLLEEEPFVRTDRSVADDTPERPTKNFYDELHIGGNAP